MGLRKAKICNAFSACHRAPKVLPNSGRTRNGRRGAHRLEKPNRINELRQACTELNPKLGNGGQAGREKWPMVATQGLASRVAMGWGQRWRMVPTWGRVGDLRAARLTPSHDRGEGRRLPETVPVHMLST